jgi:hypothetical protein
MPPRRSSRPAAPQGTPAEETPAFAPIEDDTSKLDKDRGLVVKLSEVLGLIERLRKTGYNKSQNYRFATESDLTDMIRPMLARRHLFLFQSVISHSREEQYKTSGGNIMWLTTVLMSFKWVDGDSGETSEVGTFLGYGADTGDKGSGKALTNCVKYALMKTFLVSTGDDPERDESVDRAAQAREASGGRSGQDRVGPSNQPGVQRGGQSGIATEAQLGAMKEEAQRLGFGVADLHAFVQMTLGATAPTDPAEFGAYLRALTATQAGQIIGDLHDMQPAAITTDEALALKVGEQRDGEPEDEAELLAEARDAALDAEEPEQTGMLSEYGV